MTGGDTQTAEVVARLARIEQSGLLPPSVAVRAGRMRVALERPVRVTVFGLPATGKSAVVNVLAGACVTTGLPGLPTTEIVGAAERATELTLGDGRRLRHDRAPTAEDLALQPVFLRLSLPDAPGLARLSLLEVVTDGSPADLAAAIRWALPRTDIALWCTGRLSDADRLAWAAAPDEIKDHAVLVLTGAKGPVPAGRPIRSGLPEGFRAAWPLWCDRLDAALATADAAALAASGATALARAVEDMARAGRLADIEAALLVLARFEPPDWRPAPDRPPGDAFAGAGEPAPVSGSGTAPSADTPAATPAAEPAAVAEAAAGVRPGGGAGGATAHDRSRAVAAVLHLRGQAAALLADVAPDLDAGGRAATAWAAEVLGRCAALAGELSEILQPDELDLPGEDDGLADLRAAVDEVADLSVLLQIEGGPSQAADAVALVCQLRRDFDRALAVGRLAAGALAA